MKFSSGLATKKKLKQNNNEKQQNQSPNSSQTSGNRHYSKIKNSKMEILKTLQLVPWSTKFILLRLLFMSRKQLFLLIINSDPTTATSWFSLEAAAPYWTEHKLLELTGGRIETSPSLAGLRQQLSCTLQLRSAKENSEESCTDTTGTVLLGRTWTGSHNLSTTDNLQFSVSGILLTTPLLCFQCILSKEKAQESSSEVQRQRWQKTTSYICISGQICCWTFFFLILLRARDQKSWDIKDLPSFKLNYWSPNLTCTWAERYLTMQNVPAASLVLAKHKEHNPK